MAGYCAVGYDDGILRVFGLAERKMTVKWQPHKRAVNNISYSITGEYKIIGTYLMSSLLFR